jgi:hypothetical protein
MTAVPAFQRVCFNQRRQKVNVELRAHETRSFAWQCLCQTIVAARLLSLTAYCGSRQQCGLQGPASGGGHEDAIDRLPDATRPAAALISLSIFFEPHFGHAGFSVRPTRSSAWCEQSSQENSNNGIFRDPVYTRYGARGWLDRPRTKCSETCSD